MDWLVLNLVPPAHDLTTSHTVTGSGSALLNCLNIPHRLSRKFRNEQTRWLQPTISMDRRRWSRRTSPGTTSSRTWPKTRQSIAFFKRCIRLRSCNACIQQHVTGDGPNDVPLIVSGGSRSRDEKRCTNGSCDDRPHEEAAAPIPGLSPAASCSPRAGLFSCIPFIR
jgi:hypothetical protein